MKKIIISAAVFLSLLSFSCEEDFNAKADFVKKYVLWCVVSADAKYDNKVQYAIVSKLYNVDGFDPYTNKTDPVLSGAEIRLYSDQNEYVMTEDTSRRRDTTRYPAQFIYYRTEPVKIRIGSILKIKATLPTGEILTSETKYPQNEGLTFSNTFYRGFSTIKRDTLDTWTVWWKSNINHLFFPKLTIQWTKEIGDSVIGSGAQLVAAKYVDNKPYYPDYTTEQKLVYDFDAIDSAMALLSKGDTAKNSYVIHRIYFELLEFDGPLSQYYGSINGYLDNYSIRLDESVYSNVGGGIGIFGSSFYISRPFIVAPGYAQKFGYISRKTLDP